MHSIAFWPALTLLAGAAATAPAVQDSGTRAFLYWLVIPSLAMGIAALWVHGGVL